MNLVVGELLLNSVNKYPKRNAIVGDDASFTYEELNRRVNRIANNLLAGGLKKGDRLAILLMNCYQFVELIMACAKSGIIMVPVNWRFQAPEIKYVVDNSDACAMIMGEEFIPTMETAANDIKQIPADKYWVVGSKKFRDAGGLYQDLVKEGSTAEPAVKIDPEDILCIGYTSGTTGFPKGAVTLHKTGVETAVVMNLEFVTSYMVNLIVMPTFHSNSINNVMASFLSGMTIHIYHLRGFNGEEILQIIDKYKVNISSMVPTMYNIILALPEEVRNKYDVSSMTTLLSSSAPISAKTKKEILSFFKNGKLYEGYGATETGVVTALRPEDQLRKLNSVGQAVFGKQIKILDPDGNEMKPGEIGEIYTRGINIFKGYLKNPEATKAAFRGDWCAVGDMGYVDEENYLYLVDRKNDMIISGGENIYPTEVENIIYAHPSVREVAIVGVPDEFWGESVKAVVLLKDGMSATPEEIIEFTKGKIAGYKRPRTVDFVTELPMTPTGKILRRLVKEKYWHGKDTRII
ncbi:MAG: long-chain-fatty-acid--CoA ligase [Dehalococcoidia bacterium]|nr:long-chain-fatty-acid--CoA ligase [Dehalococcoidia bacterium]